MILRQVRGGERVVSKSFRWFSCSVEEVKGYDEIPGPRSWPIIKAIPDVALTSFRCNGSSSDMFHSYYKRYGSVFKFEVPRLKFVMVSSPHDAVKVLQNEGKYPYGGASAAWPFIKYGKEHQHEGDLQRGILADGEEWKQARIKIAPPISSPKSARKFLPAMAEATAIASKEAGCWEDSFDQYLNRVAFDLFAALSIGDLAKTTIKSSQDDNPVYEEFVTETLQVFHRAGALIQQPFPEFTKKPYQGFAKHFERSAAISDEFTGKGLEAIENGTATEFQKLSYMSKLLDSTKNHASVKEGVRTVLQAGVDTTAYVLCWFVLNMGYNSEKQEKLKEELDRVLKGRTLQEDDLHNVPYLKACIRESHRLTPPAPISIMKRALVPLNLSGYTIPAGELIALNGKQFG